MDSRHTAAIVLALLIVVASSLDARAGEGGSYEYRLLATNKTSTMQKELQEAGAAGFEFVGVTVGQTSFGGSQVVTILRRTIAM